MIAAYDVLARLDEAVRQDVFPVLDNGYVYPAGTQLTVLSDRQRWGIMFQVVGYNARQPGCLGIDTCAYLFGSCFSTAKRPFKIWFPVPEQGETLVSNETVVGRPSTLVVGGATVPFPTRDEFALAGTPVRQGEPIHAASLLRTLVFCHRRRFFASAQQIEGWVQPGGAPPVILELEEWRHPDISSGEVPSGVRCIRDIALVAASGDASQFRLVEKANTHWSNWPMGGTLLAL